MRPMVDSACFIFLSRSLGCVDWGRVHIQPNGEGYGMVWYVRWLGKWGRMIGEFVERLEIPIAEHGCESVIELI